MALWILRATSNGAFIAQLGERQTEDLKVPGSIPGGGNQSQIFWLVSVAQLDSASLS